ncbi:YidB family protein [Methyloglobulus sp.]|uniref:YidB family protein n=1 Tax=Methyloglobulus sp. TaxID=2518622 RepID=UPI0032B85124
MGILDTLLGLIKSQATKNAAPSADAPTGSSSNLLDSVIDLISDPQTGGLSGLVEKIAAGGLGDQVASWVGTGENLPISAEQLQAVLGSPFVQGLAEKFGINTADVAGSLSSLLPQVIDKLTPDGQVPGDNKLLEIGLAGLKSILGSKTA